MVLEATRLKPRASPNSVVLDAAAFAGLDEMTPQMKRFQKQIELVRLEYGVGAITELLGYSKGAIPCVKLGNRLGISSTTFNGFVSSQTLASSTSKIKGVTHQFYRTTEDPVSTLLAFRRKGGNIKVTAVDGHAGFGSPEAQHRLENFTENKARGPGEIADNTIEMHRRAQVLSELETLQWL